MKALSIRQPWAHRILREGKDIENRDWPTRYRGPVLIHAGIKIDCDHDEVRAQDMPVGGIVGWCEITDCVSDSTSEWFVGWYGFVLANPHPLPLIRCKGALSFFRPDIAAEVVRMHVAGELTEGQATRVLSIRRIELRRLADEFMDVAASDKGMELKKPALDLFDEATRQPDMFVAPPDPQPKQEPMI